MKRLAYILPLLALACLAVAWTTRITSGDAAASGLVAWWPLDDNGATTPDRIGGANGTLQGTPPTVNGVVGKALSFSGANRVTTTFTTALTDFTACLWFKATANNGGYDRVIDKTYNGGFYVGRDNGAANSWRFGIRETSFPYGTAVTLVDGQWHHICITRLGTLKSVYGDGVRLATNTVSSTALSTSALAIGATEGGSIPFIGIIDDVRIYNRALSAAEVSAMYNARKHIYQ